MEMLKGKSGWIIGVLSAILVVAAGYWGYKSIFGYSSYGEDSRYRWFVCSEMHKPFRAELKVGETIPVESPFSHKATGYPAELCYWNADGTIKDQPTPVLLNSAVDPGDHSPTFCPDCGRLVVAHNPPPVAGHAPPTAEEFKQRTAARNAAHASP